MKIKEITALCTSLICSLALVSSFTASAEDSCIPTFYFKLNSNNAETVSEDIIMINPEQLDAGDITLNLSVYIDDESKSICSISPKWKIKEKEYISLENLINPELKSDTSTTYTNKLDQTFTTDMTPFPYAKITAAGAMQFSGGIIAYNLDPDSGIVYDYYDSDPYNVMFLTCHRGYKALDVLGATTDEYAYATFDAVINEDTPEGVYELYFLTEAEDYKDQQVTMGSYFVGTKPYTCQPILKSMKIVVGDYDTLNFKLGDVNFDGDINAIDASLVLSAYASDAIGNGTGLDKLKTKAADVDENSVVNAIDASKILGYYAYTSTGGDSSFEDFLKQ